MAWTNLVKPLSTADVAGTVVSQRFRHPTLAMCVSGVIPGIIGFGNPAFGNLKMRIYSDRAGSPGKLIAESTNQWDKADVHTLAHFIKFAGFEFDNVQLQAGVWYHLVLLPSAYTGVDASYIGWRYSYPKPQYPINIDEDTPNALRHHLEFSLVGYTIGEDD